MMYAFQLPVTFFNGMKKTTAMHVKTERKRFILKIHRLDIYQLYVHGLHKTHALQTKTEQTSKTKRLQPQGQFHSLERQQRPE